MASAPTGSRETDKRRFGGCDAIAVTELAYESRGPSWAERRELRSDRAACLRDAAEELVDEARIAGGVLECLPRLRRVQQLVGEVDHGNQVRGRRPEVCGSEGDVDVRWQTSAGGVQIHTVPARPGHWLTVLE